MVPDPWPSWAEMTGVSAHCPRPQNESLHQRTKSTQNSTLVHPTVGDPLPHVLEQPPAWHAWQSIPTAQAPRRGYRPTCRTHTTHGRRSRQLCVQGGMRRALLSPLTATCPCTSADTKGQCVGRSPKASALLGSSESLRAGCSPHARRVWEPSRAGGE